MLIAAASSISFGPSHCHDCHAEGVGCSTSHGFNSSWINSFEGQRFADYSAISFRCDNPYFGVTRLHWLPLHREFSLSKVSVSADYSDSVPDSSSYMDHNGYHPLEDLKDHKIVHDTMLTSAEIARTTVEANNSALLIFPSTVHCEPHEHISWAEFQYVTDEWGDIIFEIPDDENILHDRGASNPVNALFGMDIPLHINRWRDVAGYNISEGGFSDEVSFGDGYFEVEGSEMYDDSGKPYTSSLVHPIYFGKCLTKAVNAEYTKKIDHPSNGVSILGCLRPVFMDEESYLRRLFIGEDSDGYTSNLEDGEVLSFSSKGDENRTSSTIYRLETMRIELFSVYGAQSAISLQDFQDAEPDILLHSTPEIIEHFCEKGIRCNFALIDLCRRKGFHVEEAILIGVDSLGMDVRVFSRKEVRTHRFPFKVRATSESAAEKQIQQLLFPRSRRKKNKGSW